MMVAMEEREERHRVGDDNLLGENLVILFHYGNLCGFEGV